MLIKKQFKAIARFFIQNTCFRPVHIGQYVRSLHFRRQCQRLPLRQFRGILDAGCGDGSYALEMAITCPWAEIQALDLSLPPLPLDAPTNLSSVRGDLHQLVGIEEFDFIYCIDVLEHIRNNQQVVRNFHRKLGRGGYLFLHMPNDDRQKMIFPNRFFHDFNQWADHEHIGEQYSLPELILLLTKTGFSICHTQYTFGWLGSLAWELDRLTDRHWRTKIILMPILKLLARISIHTRPCRGSLLVVAQK
jgi:2-polyprenyl-3-methyl-5-hydroxy-6-metoxy-1,4-benzoquinol methylase